MGTENMLRHLNRASAEGGLTGKYDRQSIVTKFEYIKGEARLALHAALNIKGFDFAQSINCIKEPTLLTVEREEDFGRDASSLISDLNVAEATLRQDNNEENRQLLIKVAHELAMLIAKEFST